MSAVNRQKEEKKKEKKLLRVFYRVYKTDFTISGAARGWWLWGTIEDAQITQRAGVNCAYYIGGSLHPSFVTLWRWCPGGVSKGMGVLPFVHLRWLRCKMVLPLMNFRTDRRPMLENFHNLVNSYFWLNCKGVLSKWGGDTLENFLFT